jgi:hypothetical protein
MSRQGKSNNTHIHSPKTKVPCVLEKSFRLFFVSSSPGPHAARKPSSFRQHEGTNQGHQLLYEKVQEGFGEPDSLFEKVNNHRCHNS